MTMSRISGPSRTGTSRAGSTAREIQKKRDKPYKTELAKFKEKRKKLKFQTSFRKAPPGYTFLPVGTPDLATRCKELSRQLGAAVHVVNAKPVSKNAQDPDKVSHHIHRVGYHFKTEIVDEAREELGYIFYRGQLVKESVLQESLKNSRLAQIVSKHGVDLNQHEEQETTAQVRGAIKELFPKIPDADLEQIVATAWKEGSKHVGLNKTLGLPRRVQLATIASIRHNYTDYDRLLKAFEWSEARKEVEPVCLKKLIEWRGENDDQEDNELEEIVRETIVIDDSDEGNNGSEADDEDSIADLGDMSDTSIEFVRQVAADEDLAAESVDEASRSFLQRYRQPRARRTEERERNTNIARQKIGVVRQQMRNAPLAPPPVQVEIDQNGQPPNTIVVDGEVFRLAPHENRLIPTTGPFVPFHQQHGASSLHSNQQIARSRAQPSSFASSFDRPVQSIERDENPEAAPVEGRQHYPPALPEQEYSNNRRVADPDRGRMQALAPVAQPMTSAFPQPRGGLWPDPEVIDLTTPGRPRRPAPQPQYGYATQPEVVDLTEPNRYDQAIRMNLMRGSHAMPMNHAGHNQCVPSRDPGESHRLATTVPQASHPYTQQTPADSAPYDPNQPLLQLHDFDRRQVEQTNPRPQFQTPTHGYLTSNPQYQTLPPQHDGTYDYGGRQLQMPAYPTQPPQSQSSPLRLHAFYNQLPQPVHGAPAPVQQVLRDPYNTHSPRAANASGHHAADFRQYMPLSQPPVNGSPHPTQMFQRR